MNRQSIHATTLVALTLVFSTAQAGMFDNLKNQAGNALSGRADNGMSSSGATGAGAGALLGQLGGGSFNLASPQNVAGVLGYCQKQGYAPSVADTVKSRLMNKLGGADETQQDDSYQQGLNGVLQGGDGQRFSLAGLKSTIGKKVCGRIANQAMSSFLGG